MKKIAFVCHNIVDEKNRTRYNRAFFLCNNYDVHLLSNGEICKEIAGRAISVNQFPPGIPSILFPFWALFKILRLGVSTKIVVYTTYEPLNILVGFFAQRLGMKWIADIWDDPEKKLMIAKSAYGSRRVKFLIILRRIEHLISKMTLKKSDYCITLIKPELINKYGMNEKRILAITNGVNIDIEYPRQRETKNELFTMIYVGPMERNRISLFPSLFERLYEKIGPFNMYFIGPDILGGLNWFKKQISSLSPNVKINFLGRIPHEKVLYFISKSDISLCIYPKKVDLNPAYPIKLFESMFMCKPVVATKLRGISEIITPGINGFLVEPGDINETVRIITFLKDNPEIMKKIGESAKKRAVQFDWKIIHERLAIELNGLLNKQKC